MYGLRARRFDLGNIDLENTQNAIIPAWENILKIFTGEVAEQKHIVVKCLKKEERKTQR